MSTFEYKSILSTLGDNGVRTIALNRPDSLNAMNRQLIDDVALAFDDANADEMTRAIILQVRDVDFVLAMIDETMCIPPMSQRQGSL